MRIHQKKALKLTTYFVLICSFLHIGVSPSQFDKKTQSNRTCLIKYLLLDLQSFLIVPILNTDNYCYTLRE